jgi:spore germination cell wall hydrolase CwlJ-like protein
MTNVVIIIALTLFGEAAGESIEGKRAVASVIFERAGGDTNRFADVCKAPRQFSCWNKRAPRVPNDYPSRKAWRECVTIAVEMTNGVFVPTITATHYHSGKAPEWANGMRLVAVIGGHRFYRKAE